MKKKLFGLLLAAAMIISSISVFAEDIKGGDWYVNYSGGKYLESNFDGKSMSALASTMQPGDTLTFTIKTQNTKDKDQAVNYYLKNDIIKSFEDATATGAIYSYKLEYKTAAGTDRLFYDNTAVGGSDGAGLEDIDISNSEFFFIDQLGYGEEGLVTLTVELDGETQGNAYFNTLAELNLQFQVEEVEKKAPDVIIEKVTTTPGKTVYVKKAVDTGDFTTKVPFIVACGVAGIILLILAIILVKRRKQTEE